MLCLDIFTHSGLFHLGRDKRYQTTSRIRFFQNFTCWRATSMAIGVLTIIKTVIRESRSLCVFPL